MNDISRAKLLSIVEVDKQHRVLCQQPACGHSVWKAIHVVEEAGDLLVLGSQCFAIRYGSLRALGGPSYSVDGGRKLTDAERLLLQRNTQEFIARLKAEYEELQALAAAKLEKLSAPTRQKLPVHPLGGTATRPSIHAPARSGPWTWQRPKTSMAYFCLKDGSGWVRVQRGDGQQMLAPLPIFDGWDEALPVQIGQADHACAAYRLVNVEAAIAFLRARSWIELVTGIWSEIVKAAESSKTRNRGIHGQ